MTGEFWFLIGAALVFWMQAGFAMVETGFTRAKNAGNIIMKNLMDFCIGTVVFSLLGYTLMMGEDMFFGLIGKPNLDLFLHFKEGDARLPLHQRRCRGTCQRTAAHQEHAALHLPARGRPRAKPRVGEPALGRRLPMQQNG